MRRVRLSQAHWSWVRMYLTYRRGAQVDSLPALFERASGVHAQADSLPASDGAGQEAVQARPEQRARDC